VELDELKKLRGAIKNLDSEATNTHIIKMDFNVTAAFHGSITMHRACAHLLRY
jgi:hypothetical protein